MALSSYLHLHISAYMPTPPMQVPYSEHTHIHLQQLNTAPLWHFKATTPMPPAESAPHLSLRWHLGPGVITAPAYYSSAKQGFAYNSSGKKGEQMEEKEDKRWKKQLYAYVRLVRAYWVCDQNLQYMQRRTWTVRRCFNPQWLCNNTGPKAGVSVLRWQRCVCVLWKAWGLIYLWSQHHLAS